MASVSKKVTSVGLAVAKPEHLTSSVQLLAAGLSLSVTLYVALSGIFATSSANPAAFSGKRATLSGNVVGFSDTIVGRSCNVSALTGTFAAKSDSLAVKARPV